MFLYFTHCWNAHYYLKNVWLIKFLHNFRDINCKDNDKLKEFCQGKRDQNHLKNMHCFQRPDNTFFLLSIFQFGISDRLNINVKIFISPLNSVVTNISDYYVHIIERKCAAHCKRLKKTKMVSLYSWQNYFMQWWTHHHIMSCSFSAFVVSNDNSFHMYLCTYIKVCKLSWTYTNFFYYTIVDITQYVITIFCK